jgi:uncharacterized membrane protein YebE (DUF533 family)
MFDPKQLLDQVLGPAAVGNARSAGRDVMDRLDATQGSKAFAGGAVAGGLLGLLLGGGRRHGGGLLGYGGAAALGALALRAYQNYQIKQGATLPPGDFAPAAMPHASPAADGSPFELVLVRAMATSTRPSSADCSPRSSASASMPTPRRTSSIC